MTHQDIEDTVPFYAIGALEKVERQALEAHLLSGCAACRTALKEYQSVAVALPFALNIIPPPRGLKAKIMGARSQPHPEETDANQSDKPSLEPGEWMRHLIPPTSPATTSFGWALGIAMVGVVGFMMFLGWQAAPPVGKDTSQLTELQIQIDTAHAKLATLQEQLKERDEALEQTREELRLRLEELAEVKDQLIHREAELDNLQPQSPVPPEHPLDVP
ncbi:MAG: hypothetical protein AB7P24_13915 [Nitrospira sp.]